MKKSHYSTYVHKKFFGEATQTKTHLAKKKQFKLTTSKFVNSRDPKS